MSTYENYNIQIGLSNRTRTGAELTQKWLDFFRSIEDICTSNEYFFAFLMDGQKTAVPAFAAPNQFHVMQFVCEILNLDIPHELYEQLPLAGDNAYGVEFYNANGSRDYQIFGCARLKALDTPLEGMDWYLYDEMQASLRLPRQLWCELMHQEEVDADVISSWEDWSALAEDIGLPFPERGEELECEVFYCDDEDNEESLTAHFDVPMYLLFEKCSLRQLQEWFDATAARVAQLGGELRMENVIFDEEEDAGVHSSMAFSCLDYYILTFKSAPNRLFDLRVLEVVTDTPDRKLLPYRPEYSNHLTQIPPAL